MQRWPQTRPRDLSTSCLCHGSCERVRACMCACGCQMNLRWEAVTLAILGSKREREWAKKDSHFRVRHTLSVTILRALSVGGWVEP